MATSPPPVPDTPTSPTIDLLASATFDGGHPSALYRWLREHDPVHRHEEPDGPGFWALTRYADVRAVGCDAGRYSSEPTVMITDPTTSAEERALFGDHKMMLMADPPYHTRLRRSVSAHFTPRSTRLLADRIRELAVRIVDEVIEAGSCDFVAQVAGEMPSYVIADLMGLPLDDGRELYRLTDTIHAAADAVTPGEQQAAVQEMFAYGATVYAEKSASPGDDLSTAIINTEIDGRRLDQLDFLLFFLLLIDAGGDTTRNLVAGGVHQLFANPEQLTALRADVDGLLPDAIEEMLRHTSPVVWMRRTATEDHRLGDVEIAAGDKVVMYYGAANRDPDVFDDPERFDITRSDADRHLAFGGGGPHYCLEANLARLEIDAILREVLTRMPDLHPTA